MDFLFSFKLHTVSVYGYLPCFTNPLVSPCSHPFLFLLSSPFLLPFRLSFLPSCLPYPHVCMLKYVCVRVIRHLCECVFVCLCVRGPITPQKPLCLSSLAFSAVAKTGPSLGCCSAASGGDDVGLPGHVSGWWPCQSDARQNSICLLEDEM